jgi:glycerol-3-phosphate dehydrogenase (NAD(P)+)
MRVAVIGAGSWGTALGMVLARNRHTVTMWDIDVGVLDAIQRFGENRRYLPGHRLPPGLGADPDIAAALDGAELVVMAAPSQAVRRATCDIVGLLAPGTLLCCVAKGAEVDTLMVMSEVLEDVLPPHLHPYVTFLSGPSFASEVAAGMPTAVTVASRVRESADKVQVAFHTEHFRPYTTTDVMGVEIGGCVKNVIAIASGAIDGLGFGANARAALITRGLAETTRLAAARGADPLTLAGLAGVGDLLLTCSSPLSRNFRVGVGLGHGRPLDDVQAELGQVAEGVVNACSTYAMAQRYEVDMPISTVVYRMVHDGLPAAEALHELLTRDIKPERW